MERFAWKSVVRVALHVLGPISFALLSASPATAQEGFGEWSAPVSLGPAINSVDNDEGPAISRDGLSLYFTSNRSGSQDLWVARREHKDDPWGEPVNLGAPVNTSSTEQAPAFSRDGHLMFFVSNRGGGAGGLDIWVSFRADKHDDFAWEAPVNVGASVNSASNDAGPGTLRVGDEQLLFFTSNRPGGPGGADIFVSVRQEDGSFGAPERVAELNSSANDARAALRRDGREVFFFSNRGGSQDLWTATREDRRDLWSIPVGLGPVVNSSSDEVQPAISRDGTTLFFASNRPGGAGLLDLYMITRTKEE